MWHRETITETLEKIKAFGNKRKPQPGRSEITGTLKHSRWARGVTVDTILPDLLLSFWHTDTRIFIMINYHKETRKRE